MGKESACNAGDPGSVPGLGRSPGEGNGNPLQNSCLESSMNRGASWAIVHGAAKSWTRLSNWAHTTEHSYFLNNSPDFHIIPSITSLWIISLIIFNQESWIYKMLIHGWWFLSVSSQNQSVVLHTFYSWEFWIIENFNEMLYSTSSLVLSLYTTSSQLSFTTA